MFKWLLTLILFPTFVYAINLSAVIQYYNAAGGAEQTYTAVDAPSDADGNSTGNLANGATANAYNPSENFDLTRVAIMMARDGAATGTVYCAVYQSATAGNDDVPDDRVQLASGTIDASTLPDQSTPDTLQNFDFATSPSLVTSDFYQIVFWHTGTGNVEFRQSTFGEAGQFTRNAGAPAETNDASEWSETDANGWGTVTTYKSP